MVSETGGGLESKTTRPDSNPSPVTSLSPGLLMSPLTTWNVGSSSSSSSTVNRARRRPKRRVGQFHEDQENVNPAAVCSSSVAATSHLIGFSQSEANSACRSPASKKHCSKATTAAAAVKRKHSSIVDSSATECDSGEMQTGGDRGSTDITIKSALNCSDDRLHELIGDFSRPYCLPFIESDKHRDLRAISCHTVRSGTFSLHSR